MKEKCLAIIPARGNSKGIPRKNARLLNGKPLISYVIKTALEAKCFSDVIVSTEDEEISYIAQKFGVRVQVRPSHLSNDHTGLDEVINHVVKDYEIENKIKCDYIACIQPTSPLLKPITINRALQKCIKEKSDTLLSAIDDRHLSWKISKNNLLVPDYQKRLNRQYLPKNYRETGGIVICKRSLLKSGTRFGKKISILQLQKSEAIDIDDRFDWWVVEKQLKRKKIVFRVEGYDKIGLGHVYRCLVLADNMLNHDITFISSRASKPGIKLINSRFYPLLTFTYKRNELQTIFRCNPDIVVNDILDTSKSYIKSLKSKSIRVINLEDQGHGSRYADSVINAMYGDKKTTKNMYSGLPFVCLRDEFTSAKTIRIKRNVKNVLVLFGGTDPSNLTKKVMSYLKNYKRTVAINVIIGPGYQHKASLSNFIRKNFQKKCNIISDTKIITKYMEQADVAITSGGRTVFELASLGVPMLVIYQNNREKKHVFTQNEPGIICLGSAGTISPSIFHKMFSKTMQSYTLRKKMHQSLLKNNLHKGVKNTWKVILEDC